MTVRLTQTDVNDTEQLLGAILTEFKRGNRVQFLCDPSMGKPIMQRVRVKLSRVRTALKQQGKPMQHYTLHHTIHNETHAGKRYDAVVVWHTKSIRHSMTERLEDMVGHGSTI